MRSILLASSLVAMMAATAPAMAAECSAADGTLDCSGALSDGDFLALADSFYTQTIGALLDQVKADYLAHGTLTAPFVGSPAGYQYVTSIIYGPDNVVPSEWNGVSYVSGQIYHYIYVVSYTVTNNVLSLVYYSNVNFNLFGQDPDTQKLVFDSNRYELTSDVTVPGPIAGAGLPAILGGAAWYLARRRKAAA